MPLENVVSFPAQEKGASKPRHKKRADGRYRDVYRYKDPVTGKTVEKYFYGKTFSEASAKKKEFVRAIETGLDASNEKITVAQYVNKWLELRALKDKDRKTTRTFDTYKREAMRLVEALGTKQLRQVTKSDIQAVLLTRSGMSKKAINSTYTTFHQIFLSALGDRVILFDPMLNMEKPEGTEGTHRILEEWEKNLIISSWESHRGGLIAMLMLFTGLRRGEACALRWEDVDFDKNEIRVSEALSFLGSTSVRGATKTDAGVRIVPLLPPLRPVLEKYRRPSGSVCLSALGEEMNEAACESVWRSYLYNLSCIKNGKDKRAVTRRNKKAMKEEPALYDEQHPKYLWEAVEMRMHDLRHTYCTLLFDAGVDVKTAQYLMGHASIEVTLKIYTHLSNLKKRSSLDRLIAFSKAWGAPSTQPASPPISEITVGQMMGQEDSELYK